MHDGFCFVCLIDWFLASYSWVGGPPCSVIISHWRKQIFVFRCVSTTESFLVRGETLCSLTPFQGWDVFWLEPVQACAYWHSLCEFVRAAVLCLEDTAFLESPITSGSYNLPVLSSTKTPDS